MGCTNSNQEITQAKYQNNMTVKAKMETIDKNGDKYDFIGKCIQDLNCIIICDSENCCQVPFMCNDYDCKCYDSHKNCKSSLKWKQFKEKFQNKLKESQKVFMTDLELIKYIYKNIISKVQNLLFQLQQINYEIRLSQIEKQIISKMRQKKFNELNGSLIRRVQTSLEIQNTIIRLDIQKEKKFIETQTNKTLDLLLNLNKKMKNKNQLIKKQVSDELMTKKKNLTPNTNIQNILMSNRFDVRVSKIKKEMQDLSLKMRDDLIIRHQQMDLLIEDAEQRFLKIKEHSLQQFVIYEQKIIRLKNEKWYDLPTAQLNSLLNELQQQVNRILESLIVTSQTVYSQIDDFRIYVFQKFKFFNKKIRSMKLLYKASENNLQGQAIKILCIL